MDKKLIRLTESDLHRMVKESVKRILKEQTSNNDDLIMDVILSGDFVNINNSDGYDIGVGYGDGNKKSFFYPYSERLEHFDCHVSIDEIKRVIAAMQNDGYEFESDGNYVYLKGERKAFKPFVPHKKSTRTSNNKRLSTVDKYVDSIFTTSKDGSLQGFF